MPPQLIETPQPPPPPPLNAVSDSSVEKAQLPVPLQFARGSFAPSTLQCLNSRQNGRPFYAQLSSISHRYLTEGSLVWQFGGSQMPAKLISFMYPLPFGLGRSWLGVKMMSLLTPRDPSQWATCQINEASLSLSLRRPRTRNSTTINSRTITTLKSVAQRRSPLFRSTERPTAC